MKNKLYKIGMLGMVHNITIEDFKGLKRRCGDRLKIEIDDEINQVILQDEHIRESAGHILRVYNNETAETLLDGAFIFADKKVPM